MYNYLAKFYITKGQTQGHIKCYAMNIEAKNAKEAKEKIQELWAGYDWPYKRKRGLMWHEIPHMFSIKIKRLKAGDEWLFEWFTPISQEEYHDENGGLKHE